MRFVKKFKIIETILYALKITLKETVVSAIEETLLCSSAFYPYLETHKTFLASTGLHCWKQKGNFAREPIR